MPFPTSWCRRLLTGWLFAVFLCAPLAAGCGGGEPEPRDPDAVKREQKKINDLLRKEKGGK